MDKQTKIFQLKRLLEKADSIRIETSTDSSFNVWKTNVERTLFSVFGEGSIELLSFRKLNFRYTGMKVGAGDYRIHDLNNSEGIFL